MRVLIALAAAVALAACGEEAAPSSAATLTEITAAPEAYDGEKVSVVTGYYGGFEISVLTSGFAESYPPQPVDPLVWVGQSPPDRCVEREQQVVWSERVRVSGVFRYDPERGFGHLGAYDMAIQNPTVTCA